MSAWAKPVVIPWGADRIEVVDVVDVVVDEAVDVVVVPFVVTAIGRDELFLESVVDLIAADLIVVVGGTRRLCGRKPCRSEVVRFGCLECPMSALDTPASVAATYRGAPSACEVNAASFAAKEAASEYPGAASG
jgi:hypothetical protein